MYDVLKVKIQWMFYEHSMSIKLSFIEHSLRCYATSIEKKQVFTFFISWKNDIFSSKTHSISSEMIYFQCQKLMNSPHQHLENVRWYENDFHLEMTFLATISIWKWFFWNDLLPQKMISGCFWGKKMIYRCEKSFPSSSEMIFYTRKWFRRNSKMIFVKWFLEHFAPVLKMWFTLGKKTISCGNGHFRKWMEIIFIQKMLDNLPYFNSDAHTKFQFLTRIPNILNK